MSEISCEWKESPIFPNEYLVSSFGNVLSKRTNKILKPATDKYGYFYYVLCVNGKRITVKGHRLVAKAFISNPENKPTVDHLNGDRKDNRVNNLRWATGKEQLQNEHTKATKRRISKRLFPDFGKKWNYNRKPVIVYRGAETIKFPSVKAAALFLNVSYSKLSEIVNGQLPQRKEFTVYFGDDDKGTKGDWREFV